MRAIGQHGPEVGMDEIAAEAGVSKPVLYRHFHDKSDLFAGVGSWGTRLLMQRLSPTINEGGSPRERIHLIIDTYLTLIEEYPDLYRFVVHRAYADRPTHDDPVGLEKAEIANTLSRMLGEFMRILELDSGGVEPWSHGLVGMVQASGEWWLDRRSMSREDLARYLTRIIWHAIDGVLRSGGIVLDPDEPLAPELHVVPDIVDEETDETGS